MPELPEVESFARALNREYRGKKISEVHFRRPNIRYVLDTAKLSKILRKGSQLMAIKRDGKQLVIKTSAGEINVSLGMSGSFLPTNIAHPHKHEHVSLGFSDGSAFGYIDPRRFGSWQVQKPLPHLADPLKCGELKKLFSSDKFLGSSRRIKDMLMDQKLIGGIGNIYALEALHEACILPHTPSNSVATSKLADLANIIPRILRVAINKGGSSIATYRGLHGDKGGFQEHHKVYDREGEPCFKRNCHGIIIRIKTGGRSSWYCPKCQK